MDPGGSSKTKRFKTRANRKRREQEQAGEQEQEEEQINSLADYTRYFPNDAESQEKFASIYFHKKIIQPKWVKPEFFTKERFDIAEILHSNNLLQLCGIHCSYAPTLVRAFYTTLTYSRGTLYSKVKGIRIRVRMEDWAQLIGYPMAPQSAQNFDGVDFTTFLQQYNREEFLQEILLQGEYRPLLSCFSPSIFTVPNRMLHYVLTHTIIPRLGNHAEVQNADLFIMWALKNRAPINWADTICRTMILATRAKKNALPYACLVQQILEWAQIPTQGESPQHLTHMCQIKETTLKKCKLKKVNRVWVYQNPPQHQANEPDMPADAPPVNEEVTLSSFMTYMTDYHTQQRAREDINLARYQHDIYHLHDHINQLHLHHGMAPYITPQFQPGIPMQNVNTNIDEENEEDDDEENDEEVEAMDSETDSDA